MIFPIPNKDQEMSQGADWTLVYRNLRWQKSKAFPRWGGSYPVLYTGRWARCWPASDPCKASTWL